MFVLIWLTLLFSVSSNNNTGGTGKNDSHITGNISAFSIEDLTAVTQRHNSTLTFTPSPEHHSTNVTCKVSFADSIATEETVTLNVTDVTKLKITGTTAVKEGDTLNLTCSLESSSSYLVTWTKVSSIKSLDKETKTDLQSDYEVDRLIIPNVTAGHSGQYMCTVKHLNVTLSENINVTVMLLPKILNSSGCISQPKVLICTCVSEGFPLPTIKWPMLESHTEYSVNTTMSNHTISSTVILTAEQHSDSVVECVSSNQNGEVKWNIPIKTEEKEEDEVMKLLQMVTRLEIIIAFLIGALLSATVCCLFQKCHRKEKQKTYHSLAGTLEMVTSHEDPMIDAGQAVEDDQAIGQEAAEAEGAVVMGKSDVEYSNLDFFLIKRQSPAEAGTTKGTTETDYAEIKKEKAEVHRGDGEGYEETKHCVSDEEEGEDAALYSTVKDVRGQI